MNMDKVVPNIPDEVFCYFSFPPSVPSPPSFTCTTPTPPGAGGWSPSDTDRYQWLQVDLGSRKQVVAIATQGRYSSSDWTSKYRLLYSDTQKNWRPYLQDGNIWVRNISKLSFQPFKPLQFMLKRNCWNQLDQTTQAQPDRIGNSVALNLKVPA